MKRNEIIMHEHKKGVKAVKYNQKPQTTIEPPKPRNPVAKNANASIGGGAAGSHKNEKKASQSVRGQKHKNVEMAEGRRDYGYDDFGNSLRPGSDEGNTEPPNNFAVYINGKKWKVFPGRGTYADDEREMKQFYSLKDWAKRKSESTGKEWQIVRTGENPTVEEMGQEVGKITKVDPMTKKATVTKSDGSTMDVDSTSLKPTSDGKMQIDTPDSDELKTGTPVVSTEGTAEEMVLPSNDSQSPIPGDNDHDEISKLLVKRLRRLAGL